MKDRLYRSGRSLPYVIQGLFVSGGTASHVCLGGWQFVLYLVCRKGSRSYFQLKGVTGCPIPQMLVLHISEGKGAMPFISHTGAWVVGRRDSTPICGRVSCQVSSVWGHFKPSLPPRAKWQSVIPVVACSTAAGLFLQPTVNIFSQRSKSLSQKVSVLPQSPCSSGDPELYLGCMDQYRYCQIVGAGTVYLEEDVGNKGHESLLTLDKLGRTLLQLCILVVKA